jgi:hypothetical protein
LALFRRRSPERILGSSLPASENLHRKGLLTGLKILRDIDQSITTGRAVNHWDCGFGPRLWVNARRYGSVITGEFPRR